MEIDQLQNRNLYSFENHEWFQKLERETLKELNRYSFYGLGNEQKKYSMYETMLNYDGFQISHLKLDITSDVFVKEFRMFADRLILPKVLCMTGNKITFEELFCHKEAVEMNQNQKFLIIYMMLRWLKKTYFYNPLPSSINVYVNLKNEEYAIYKAGCKVLKCSLNENIVSYLYDLIYSDIGQYERFSAEEKLRHLMKKLDIRCDFTKKQYSYQINSHHLVIGRKCDKQGLIKLLETGDAETMNILLQYFSVVSIFRDRILPWISPRVSFKKIEDYRNQKVILDKADGMAPYDGFCFGGEFRWRYGRIMQVFNRASYICILDVDIAEFLAIMAPAGSQYMINRLYALDHVGIEKKGEEISFRANLSNCRFAGDSIIKHMILGAYEEKIIQADDDTVRKYKSYISMCNTGCRRFNYKYCLY